MSVENTDEAAEVTSNRAQPWTGPVTSGPPAWEPCDAPNPPAYLDADENGKLYVHCRCLVCARCGHHTGNATQGHFWRLCTVTGTVRTFHYCCPGDCELEAAVAVSQVPDSFRAARAVAYRPRFEPLELAAPVSPSVYLPMRPREDRRPVAMRRETSARVRAGFLANAAGAPPAGRTPDPVQDAHESAPDVSGFAPTPRSAVCTVLGSMGPDLGHPGADLARDVTTARELLSLAHCLDPHATPGSTAEPEDARPRGIAWPAVASNG